MEELLGKMGDSQLLVSECFQYFNRLYRTSVRAPKRKLFSNQIIQIKAFELKTIFQSWAVELFNSRCKELSRYLIGDKFRLNKDLNDTWHLDQVAANGKTFRLIEPRGDCLAVLVDDRLIYLIPLSALILSNCRQLKELFLTLSFNKSLMLRQELDLITRIPNEQNFVTLVRNILLQETELLINSNRGVIVEFPFHNPAF